MIIAIPTINKQLISKRIGRITEVTFLVFEGHELIRQYSEEVPPHHHDHGAIHGNHHHREDEVHRQRKDIIKEKLCSADEVVYKSMCKNWRARLSDCHSHLQKTEYELLSDFVQNLNLQEESRE
jgi:hypothetical protein